MRPFILVGIFLAVVCFLLWELQKPKTAVFNLNAEMHLQIERSLAPISLADRSAPSGLEELKAKIIAHRDKMTGEGSLIFNRALSACESLGKAEAARKEFAKRLEQTRDKTKEAELMTGERDTMAPKEPARRRDATNTNSPMIVSVRSTYRSAEGTAEAKRKDVEARASRFEEAIIRQWDERAKYFRGIVLRQFAQ